MPYKIWNTALDPSCRLAQRKAAKMQMEPVIAGRRLRLRESMEISDKLFEINKGNIELNKKHGVVDWKKVGAEKAPAEAKKVEPDKKPVTPPAPPATAKSEESPPAPPVEASMPAPVVEKKEEAPPAETPSAPVEPEPHHKSPFKGKKKQS